jgi:glycosyltransferase involved in cell wall biosynthesis
MSKSHTKVSVVMVNYNGLVYLKRTVPKILDLDYPNYEFIVVDNGSSDGSLEFLKNKKGVKLVQSPRIAEKNYACNYAIKQAKGKYILLLDNDALITNRSILSELIDQYKENYGVIGLSFVNEGSKRTQYYGGYFSICFTKEVPYIDVKKVKLLHDSKIGYADGKGLFLSKEVWSSAEGYDENLSFGGDDTDLGMKLILLGYNNHLYSKTVQIHLGMPERTDNKKYSAKFRKAFYAHLYTIVKNYSFYESVLIFINYSSFMFAKSIIQSIKRKNFSTVMSFFQGIKMFFNNFDLAMRNRKLIQSKRKISSDTFLKIRPKKYDL